MDFKNPYNAPHTTTRCCEALENRNCEFYTEKEKERGLNKLNEILSANGFRRCKRTLKKVE